jgi:hypothetical protein
MIEVRLIAVEEFFSGAMFERTASLIVPHRVRGDQTGLTEGELLMEHSETLRA